jgi:hypothetical protein
MEHYLKHRRLILDSAILIVALLLCLVLFAPGVKAGELEPAYKVSPNAPTWIVTQGAPVSTCPPLDTAAIRRDLAAGYRTDREWLETIILRMAWVMDCERGYSNDTQ